MTLSKTLTKTIAAFCFFAPAGGLHAQQSNRVIANAETNAFYARYLPIIDHPECQGADQIAFEVPLSASALSFGVYDVVNSDFAWVTRNTHGYKAGCFVMQGFGRHGTRVEITCPATTVTQLEIDSIGSDYSVNMAGNYVGCFSPQGVRTLDSDWSLDITTPDGTQTTEGAFVASYSKDALGGSEETSGKSSIFHTSNLGHNLGWTLESRDHELAQKLKTQSGLDVNISCVPLNAPSFDDHQLFLEVDIKFLLFDDERAACADESCPALSRPWQSRPWFSESPWADSRHCIADSD